MKVYNQVRYNIPIFLISLITSVLPDNKVSIKIRGSLSKKFIKNCGVNFQLGRDVTLLNTNNLSIGDNVYIAKGAWINCKGNINIEDEVVIAPYVTISSLQHTFQNNSVRFADSISGEISIKKGTWIAAHSTVKQGITIGRGCLVAANSSVTKNVNDYTVVGGVPAKFIKENN
ncbi:acyltransferase [Mammaliicoccus fleurettii]|uniref:acyltransferase n=1 Tax=Mammaliicoccus TaxID=2803850 RepID=UPI001EFBC3E6|nr:MULTISPECIES: acyltransferase [Mammaliicoccus]MEB6201983.1 acyltransferase [Mammaliicoccus fleurettii]